VPVALAHNVTVVASVVGGTANASIDNGSSDADGDPLTITQTPAGPYPVGYTNVLLTVVDTKGATAQASATVTVLNPTSIAVVSSANPSTFGNAVTLTANLTPASLNTGTVTFVDGATTIGTGAVSSGTATFTTNALTVGSHSITAVFNGTLYASSTSPVLTQTVNGGGGLAADISVTLSHAPNNPVIAIGGKLTATITVSNLDATNSAQVALNFNTVPGPVEIDSVNAPAGTSCTSGASVQCSIATLAASTNKVFTVTLRPLLSDGRTLTVMATVASNGTDSNPANNNATDAIKVRFKPFRQ